ncbi:MAG TPA: periplasmic heavy metal sensor [Methylomirabilota bacterium]|jgi:Spy/CpxP family protein refolding chaperone|nr:periplasmic heavy metal sensor [Methylomirabilota bacterium]
MKQIAALLVLGTMVLGSGALALAFHEESGRAVGDLVDQLRSLGAQLERHIKGGTAGGTREVSVGQAAAERPVISIMLDHRSELGLTPEQVTRLETLRNNFARESIKRDADIRVAEMDLAALLEQEMLDMGKVEAKIQEVSKLRADLRIERLRTIEQGKAVLTPDQRTKLKTLLGTAGGGPRRTERERERPVRM